MNTIDLMREALMRKSADKVVLDGAGDTPALSGADTYTATDLKLKAASAIHQWVETDDLEDGESLADRLLALFVGIVDANKNGEIDDDEQGAVDEVLNYAWDYLSQAGVDDEDSSALLNDWDNDAAERIRDLLAASIGDDSGSDIDSFAFSSDDQEAALDAVYRMKTVIKGGKKMRINKRISGTIRLSARQKIAVRKMHMKSHGAAAMMHRFKSNKMRKRLNIK